ncbi:MAG: iron-containing alcohol dehydrogenase [Anaerolineae bacterium]
MWYFRSPKIVYGEDALSYLAELKGQRAFIVADQTMVRLGFVDIVRGKLSQAGIESEVFSEVEPEPSFQTIQRGAEKMLAYGPDWVVGLGGGSSIDAAKGMWVLYENPGLDPRAINPFEPLEMRRKALMVAIPTTSGTGAEATWAIVLTDLDEGRKLATGTPESTPDIAILDPSLAVTMPPELTAMTAMDTLTHAVEGYTSNWHNDFCDGLCLKAVGLVFDYLIRAYKDGSDMEARERLHNAATLAGLGFINSMAALAHAMGHALGGVFHTPHGRAVGLFLPYTIEFALGEEGTRYADFAYFLGLSARSDSEEEAGRKFVQAIRELARQVNEPTSIAALGIPRQNFEAQLDKLVDNTENDSQVVTSSRIPSYEEAQRLFLYAYEGKSVDF